jgi:TolB-like protein/DNA-binding winged helix-turn-helix (wHTH) protein
VQDPEYRFADLTLDIARRRLTRAGQPIELKALDFDLLRFLVESAPNVVNTEVLAEKVWGRHFVSPENAAQRIMLLRHSLSDDANKPRYIETIRNKGYRLIPIVERIAAHRARGTTSQLRWLFAAAALSVASVLAVAVYWSARSSTNPPSDEARFAANSIAVLPFENLSSDPEQAYFADGLSQELLDKLIKIEPLLVTAYDSSRVSRERTSDIATIGRELQVAHVLDGSVRKAGNQVRITVQLIDTATGFHVWSETYDGELADVLALQDEIARRVAGALQVTLGVSQQKLQAGGTEDMEAYEHYLLARSLLRQGGRDEEARTQLEEAVALDPKFGLAQVSLGQLLIRLASNAWRPSEVSALADTRDRRDRAIDRAAAIVPDLPETLWLQAQRHMNRHEWAAAGRAVEQMWERSSPNDYAANANYGDFLRRTGQAREALQYAERARLLDPLIAKSYVNLGFLYDALGDYEQAAATYDEMRANVATLIPNDVVPHLFRVAARGGVPAVRQVMIENWKTLEGDAAGPRCEDIEGGPLLVLTCDAERGMAMVREDYANTPADQLKNLAAQGMFAAHFGDTDLAAEAFGDALLSDPVWLQFAWIPTMESVRHHPRFKEVMTEMGLVDYWRATHWPERCRPLGERDFECF